MFDQPGRTAGPLRQHADHLAVGRGDKVGAPVVLGEDPQRGPLGPMAEPEPRSCRQPPEAGIEASLGVLVQVRVPGRHDGHAHDVSRDDADQAHIAWPRDVHEVGPKRTQLRDRLCQVPAESRVAGDIRVNLEGQRPPAQFERAHAAVPRERGPLTAEHAEER